MDWHRFDVDPDPGSSFPFDADLDQVRMRILSQVFTHAGKSENIFDVCLRRCQSRQVYLSRHVTGVIISIFLTFYRNFLEKYSLAYLD